MKFSHRQNGLLALQEKYGRFWIDKVGVDNEIGQMQMQSMINGNYRDWHKAFDKLLKDVFDKQSFDENTYNWSKPNDIGNFTNLYFSEKLRAKMTSSVNIAKTIKAFQQIKPTFGSVIISNKTSMVYGIYPEMFVSALLQGDTITNIELVRYDNSPRGYTCSSSFSDDGENMILRPDGSIIENPTDDDWQEPAFLLLQLIPLLTVYYFADIETSIIQSTKNKKAVLNGEKYLNEVNVPVKIIDSNWFTTIIRTDGFGVRGHFRLQACGEGMKDRKLIWINDFEKHGYTRIARKELSKVA